MSGVTSKLSKAQKAKARRLTHPPKLEVLLQAERELLRARFGAARAALSSHSGELGASLEHEALGFLRTFLPKEYGLGTGFIVWREECREEEATWRFCQEGYRVAVSPQLDIIIYDAVRGGCVADLGSSQVYPIEHVYGYVEVKALFLDELNRTLEVSNLLRGPTKGFYSGRPEAFRPLMPEPEWHILAGSFGRIRRHDCEVMTASIARPRIGCWFIGFEYERAPPKRGRTTNQLRKTFESSWKRAGSPAHFHGILIADAKVAGGAGDAVLLRSAPPNTDVKPFTADVAIDGAIGRFKRDMLTDLGVFTRLPTDIAVNYEGYWGT